MPPASPRRRCCAKGRPGRPSRSPTRLPSAAIPERLQRGQLDARVAPLLLTKALALWQLRDREGLGRLSADCWLLWNRKVAVLTPTLTTNAMVLLLDHREAEAERDLAAASEQLSKASPPADGDDPLAVLAGLRLQVLASRGAPAADSLAVLDQWQKAPGRERHLEPLLARARFHLQSGDANAALTTLAAARQRAPRDESVLHLLAEAGAAAGAAAFQDGEGLLHQCLRRQILQPDVADPTGYLLCAEAALREADKEATPPQLRAGLAAIAQRCAQKAVERSAWARWPRLLLARAALATGQPATAVAELDALSVSAPDDAEVQQLRVRARSEAGVDVTPALAAGMRSGSFSVDVQKALLRQALPHADRQSLRALVAAVTPTPDDVELLALLATAEATIGDGQAAAATLERGRPLLPAAPSEALQEDWCAAAAAILASRLMAADRCRHARTRAAAVAARCHPCRRQGRRGLAARRARFRPARQHPGGLAAGQRRARAARRRGAARRRRPVRRQAGAAAGAAGPGPAPADGGAVVRRRRQRRRAAGAAVAAAGTARQGRGRDGPAG